MSRLEAEVEVSDSTLSRHSKHKDQTEVTNEQPNAVHDLIAEREEEDKLSEISDFLDLSDGICVDLDFFNGIDSVLDTASSPLTMNEAVEMSESQEQSVQLESAMTPVRTSATPPILKDGSVRALSEIPVPSTSNRSQHKKPGRRKEASKYTCSVCKKIFQQLGHLRSHILLHTGEFYINSLAWFPPENPSYES